MASADPILIIDDDRLIRKILEHAFTEKGYPVASAEDAEQGLELARSLRPRILILDIFLPGKWSGTSRSVANPWPWSFEKAETARLIRGPDWPGGIVAPG